MIEQSTAKFKPEYVGISSPLDSEVDQWLSPGDWKIVERSGVISAAALGPCLGVIIYDIATRSAVVGHFDDFGHFQDPQSDFQIALSSYFMKYPKAQEKQVYLGGLRDGFVENVHDEQERPNYHNEAESDRATVLKVINAYGFKTNQIFARWLPLTVRFDQTFSMLSMIIDVQSGRVHYSETIHDYAEGSAGNITIESTTFRDIGFLDDD